MLIYILIFAVLIVGVIGLAKLLAAPIKLIFKLLINAIIGFVVLFVVNFIAGYVGFYLDFTLINALIVGILGVPGVILLILLKLFL